MSIWVWGLKFNHKNSHRFRTRIGTLKQGISKKIEFNPPNPINPKKYNKIINEIIFGFIFV